MSTDVDSNGLPAIEHQRFTEPKKAEQPKVFSKAAFREQIKGQLGQTEWKNRNEQQTITLESILENLEEDHQDLEVGAAAEANILTEKMKVVLEELAAEKAKNHGHPDFETAISEHQNELNLLREQTKTSRSLDLRTRNRTSLLERTIINLRTSKLLEDRERDRQETIKQAQTKAQARAGEAEEEKGVFILPPDAYEVVRSRASDEPVELNQHRIEKSQLSPEVVVLNKKYAELRAQSQKFWLWPKTRENLKTQMKDLRAEIAALQKAGRPGEFGSASPRPETKTKFEGADLKSDDRELIDQGWALRDSSAIVQEIRKLDGEIKMIEGSLWKRFGNGRRLKELKHKDGYLRLVLSNKKLEGSTRTTKSYRV